MASDFLAPIVRARPDSPALDDGGRTWSYRELERRVGAGAHRLRGALVTGRTVALISETTGDAVMAVHAVLAAGGVLAPLNPRSTAGELRRALDVLKPRLVLAAPEAWDRALSAGARPAPLSALDGEGGEALASSGSAPAGVRDLPPDARVVLWTSGTGGSPRGVALTVANLQAGISAAAARLALGPDDRWLATLGLAHVGGLLLVLRAAVTGALVVTRGRFRPDEAAALVDAGAVTHASLVPTMLHQLLDARADRSDPSLRCLLVGGAYCPLALVERAVQAGFPVALTYGMTESTSQAATAPPALVRRKPGTVGSAVERVEIRLEGGEVIVRGPTVAAGYVGADLPLQGPGGWLQTGDVGEIDGEGHLWITGRRSDRIVTAGVNVDPVEVEDILRQHPAVSDAVVVGLPDERWGEVVAAAVVCAGGASLDPGELEKLTRARLITAKVPRRWLFLPVLPRNANGKVDRDTVRQSFPPTLPPRGVS